MAHRIHGLRAMERPPGFDVEVAARLEAGLHCERGGMKVVPLPAVQRADARRAAHDARLAAAPADGAASGQGRRGEGERRAACLRVGSETRALASWELEASRLGLGSAHLLCYGDDHLLRQLDGELPQVRCHPGAADRQDASHVGLLAPRQVEPRPLSISRRALETALSPQPGLHVDDVVDN